MKSQGNFKYKGLKRRDAGEFVNDKGEKIQYKESYQLKVDELTDSGVVERNFKIAIDSALVPQLANKPLYSDITLEFDVILYNTSARVVPVALVNSNNK